MRGDPKTGSLTPGKAPLDRELQATSPVGVEVEGFRVEAHGGEVGPEEVQVSCLGKGLPDTALIGDLEDQVIRPAVPGPAQSQKVVQVCQREER